MITEYTSGPAFPAHAQCGEETGMTLRDYMAAKAMQGRIVSYSILTVEDLDDLAKASYQVADAMLRARLA